MREYQRWIKSARYTLESARRDYKAGDYVWACFKAHQAGEKAVKALLWGVGSPKIGHAITRLLKISGIIRHRSTREYIRKGYSTR